jgi:hypothetical protein
MIRNLSARRWALAASLFLACSALALAKDSKRPPKAAAGWPYNVIPHFADGVDGGQNWTTTFILTNLGNAPSSYVLLFHNTAGAQVAVNLVGQSAPTGSVSGVLPGRGSIQYSTTGTRANLLTGWAELTYDSDVEIGVQAIFRNRVAGRPDFEAAVLASPGVDYFTLMPFDNTNGYVTAIAICNANTVGTSSIGVEILDESGAVILRDRITLTLGAQTSFTFPGKWPATAGRRGTIHFADEVNAVGVLGFRFSPSGSFTTLAVMDKWYE